MFFIIIYYIYIYICFFPPNQYCVLGLGCPLQYDFKLTVRETNMSENRWRCYHADPGHSKVTCFTSYITLSTVLKRIILRDELLSEPNILYTMQCLGTVGK